MGDFDRFSHKVVWNKNSQGNPISILMQPETHTVVNGNILLNQIPDKAYGINITGFSAISDWDYSTAIGTTQFRVDYSVGMIFFNSAKEGTQVTVSSYYGKGLIFFPYSRIWVEDDAQGNVIETLKDVVDSSNDAIDIVDETQEIIDEMVRFEVYDSGTAYKEHNKVFYNGSTYYCMQDCTNQQPDIANTYWQLMAQKGDQGEAGIDTSFRGTYNNAVTYYPKDAVNYGNDIYYCLQECVGLNPVDNPAYWTLFMSSNVLNTTAYTDDFIIANWIPSSKGYSISIPTTIHLIDSKYLEVLVYENGVVNRKTDCNETVDNDGNVVLSTFTPFDGYVVISDLRGVRGEAGQDGIPLLFKGIYDINTSYVYNNVVNYENELYVCIEDSLGDVPDVSPLNWELAMSSTGTVNTAYTKLFILTDWSVDAEEGYSLDILNTEHGFTDKSLEVITYEAGALNKKVEATIYVDDSGNVTIKSSNQFDGYAVITDLKGIQGKQGDAGIDGENATDILAEFEVTTSTNQVDLNISTIDLSQYRKLVLVASDLMSSTASSNKVRVTFNDNLNAVYNSSGMALSSATYSNVQRTNANNIQSESNIVSASGKGYFEMDFFGTSTNGILKYGTQLSNDIYTGYFNYSIGGTIIEINVKTSADAFYTGSKFVIYGYK
jgi:hypothetical protein